MSIRVGIICPSEIAFRRFLPSLRKLSEFSFAGVAIASPEEWAGDGKITADTKAIIDRERQKSQNFIDNYGGKIYEGYQTLISSPEIDVVYLPLPPALHFKWAKLVLESGKHAYVEKPFTTNLEDTKVLLEIAKKMGATLTVDGSKGEKIEDAMFQLGIRGFDVGLEMSGAPAAFNDMIEHMYKGANIAQLGILPSDTQVNWSDVIFNALTIKGITGRRMWETWYQMEQMLVGGLDLSPVITHRYNFRDFQKGFDVMVSGQCGKVLLEW